MLERIKQELIDGIPRLDVTHTEMTAELKAHMDTLARYGFLCRSASVHLQSWAHKHSS